MKCIGIFIYECLLLYNIFMKIKEEIVFKTNGWQAINRIGILNENYHTLILNYRELMNEIVQIQSAQEPFLLLFNNQNLNRYIFNFLASTSALIDSCRNVMSFYKETTIYEHYKQRVDEQFSNNSVAVFIKDLRNYQMHYKIALPCLSKEEIVSFETYELKQYNKWTKLSKEFIEEQGSFIILNPLFESYFKMLEPFYMEIYSMLLEYHKQDFKETIKLAAKINMPISDIYYQLINK